ncbi:hypothetical protein GCM10010411_84780 [Actinomadura fulvescens]|uniref:Uncharacterized protein n=1 Tax=Actinomadura fulvescens TaxID=46160 RepID=A0ABP6D3Z4_9ACTN
MTDGAAGRGAGSEAAASAAMGVMGRFVTVARFLGLMFPFRHESAPLLMDGSIHRAHHIGQVPGTLCSDGPPEINRNGCGGSCPWRM